MKKGIIAVSSDFVGEYANFFPTDRKVLSLELTDLTDAAAVVLTQTDIDAGKLREIRDKGWGLPVFALVDPNCIELIGAGEADDVITWDPLQADYYARKIEKAAAKFDREILPPFFEALADYKTRGTSNFPSPGHHGGQYFRRHPAGRRFFDFYGETLFRTDLSSSDVAMGDLLIHEGAPEKALEYAAEVFHADNTWFILNLSLIHI